MSNVAFGSAGLSSQRRGVVLRRSRQSSNPKGLLASCLNTSIWARLAVAAICLYLLFLASVLSSMEWKSSSSSFSFSSTFKDTLNQHIQSPRHYGSKSTTHKSVEIVSEHSTKTTTPFVFDRALAEKALQFLGPQVVRQRVMAFLEPPMNDTIPNTGTLGDIDDDGDPGIPPDFVVPLPLRTHTPNDLSQHEYPRLQTCDDIPGKIPVDRGLELDESGNPIVWNVFNDPTPDDYPQQEAPYCPVDADPFLPWIHDLFPSVDGTRMEFVAQNRRRCKTGRNFRKDLHRLEPQVTLMQPISVQRLSNEQQAQSLAPELWQPTTTDGTEDRPRYRLAPYEEASDDGMETRFVCRFRATDFQSWKEGMSVTQLPIRVVGETLSTYDFNYEYVSYRKGKPTLITPKGKDNKFFWASNLRFQCPIPESLQALVQSGETVLSDGTPTLFVDVVPIRTSPRFGTNEIYLRENQIGPRAQWGFGEANSHWRDDVNKPVPGFDAKTRWGDRHVLPHVDASGRWQNLPICKPPQPFPEAQAAPKLADNKYSKKVHTLSACLWASASFKTRGVKDRPITDTAVRLIEWIEFHLMVGFDHIYVYDNSGAHTNQTSLEPILSRYPPSVVTRIDWPSIVCNNNIPAHDNTGERSSQYAAENSCRTRHAPFTEWIASFDTDEYLIPMGKYTNLKDVVRDAQAQGTNILTFRSTRARLRLDTSQDSSGGGRDMISNYTFLQAYNCDSSPIPKPSWADRARKQLYRADYVLIHFVHYSTITQGILGQYKDNPELWRRHYGEHAPSERVTDEANEAVMIHTKTTTNDMTHNYRRRCHYQFEKKWRGCYVGFPWPNGIENKEGDNGHDKDGMEYNCFINEKVENYWIPRLKEALEKRMASGR